MSKQTAEQEEANKKYPLIVVTQPVDEDYNKIIRLQQAAFLAGLLKLKLWIQGVNGMLLIYTDIIAFGFCRMSQCMFIIPLPIGGHSPN